MYTFLLDPRFDGGSPRSGSARGSGEGMYPVTGGAVDARDARMVVEWITGRHESFRQAVFCAPDAPTAPAAAALGRDDVLFVPADARVDTVAHVVRYSGAFDDVGDTLHVAGYTVELQHYAAAAYVELIGPTAVRFLDADGWGAFLDDAELARDTGVFTAPLIDGRLRLADAAVLDAPFAEAAPVSLHVHGDGSATAGAQGGAVGPVGTALTTPVPRWTAIAGITLPERVAADLAARPWLGRYRYAAEVVAALGLEPGAGSIDGFGWSVLDTAGMTQPHPDDPFLVTTPAGLLLVDVRTRRRQRVPAATATVVAAVQTSPDAARAAERVAHELGVSAAAALRLCAEATDLLGVRTGVPVPGAVVGGGA
ncbi:hypothetical protein SRABI128_01140 [Microbacterium sp. Bi128]|nr:hypothetical protein SRABI128_01140 [Microbacterium sp. Bi128]